MDACSFFPGRGTERETERGKQRTSHVRGKGPRMSEESSYFCLTTLALEGGGNQFGSCCKAQSKHVKKPSGAEAALMPQCAFAQFFDPKKCVET